MARRWRETRWRRSRGSRPRVGHESAAGRTRAPSSMASQPRPFPRYPPIAVEIRPRCSPPTTGRLLLQLLRRTTCRLQLHATKVGEAPGNCDRKGFWGVLVPNARHSAHEQLRRRDGEWADRGAVYEAVDEAADEAVNESVDEAVNEAVVEAVDEAVDHRVGWCEELGLGLAMKGQAGATERAPSRHYICNNQPEH